MKDLSKCKRPFLCLIDHTYAFHRVKHQKLFHFLQDLNTDGEDEQLSRNLPREQRTGMGIDNRVKTK